MKLTQGIENGFTNLIYELKDKFQCACLKLKSKSQATEEHRQRKVATFGLESGHIDLIPLKKSKKGF